MNNEFSLGLPEIGHHLGFVHVYGQRSKGFQALLHGIATAKTKHEEDKIVQKELVSLKDHFGSSKLTAKQIKELLIRLIYCEMLGHDASFGYINAIKYAEQSALLEKKTGYLAASVCLNRNHNLVCLLINTIQKDLKSTNVVAKSTALNVICRLVDAEKIPPLLPFIVAALKDKRVEIRKKALITLKHVYQLDEDLIPNVDEELRSTISDRDPIVVSAAVQFFLIVIKKNPAKYRGYLKVFLQVLTQVMEGKLSEYNFHGVQAPWMQIKLLKILALLGHQNKSCSESMSTMLLNMMRTLPTDCNIGCAVMFECIRTTTTIYPLKPLLDLTAKKTMLFLTSTLANQKCLGITAMTALIEVNTDYAGDEKLQQVIIKCLDEDDDRTIGKKILELLYKITNSENVCVICERLLEYIRSTTEQSIKNDVARNLAQLANQYAPNVTWYVQTVNDVIQAADSPVQPDVVDSLLKVIAAGETDDQRFIAIQYLELIKKTALHDSLVQLACWILGEYGNLIQNEISLDTFFTQLKSLLDRKFEDPTTQGWIMTALAKLARYMGVYSSEANRIMDRYRTGFPAELRQRCHEINILASDMSLMKNALPSVSSEDDIKVCSSLSFLDSYVANALSAGALPYQQNFTNIQETPGTKKAPLELRFKPYEDPFSHQSVLEKDTPKQSKEALQHDQLPPESSTTSSHEEDVVTPPKKPVSQPTARAVWGPSGYTGNKIKKASEGPEKMAHQSSSEHSSGGDLPAEKPSQRSQTSEETTESTEELKDIDKSSPPSSSPVTQSRNIGLFAGIKPKSTAVTSRSIRVDPYERSKTETSSPERLSNVDSGFSPEPATVKELQLGEQNVEPEIDTVGAKPSLELGKETQRVENRITNSEEDNLLLHSIEKNSAEESVQLLSDGNNQIIKQGNAAASIVGNDSTVEKHGQTCEDDNPVGSILDADLKIFESGNFLPQRSLLDIDVGIDKADHFTDQSSSAGQGDNVLTQTNGDYKELCIDSNIRLVTCAVHNQSELVMSMKLTNHNQSRVAVEGICLKIEPPSNLITDTSETEVIVDKLSFLETVTREVSFKYQYPSTRMSFKGTLRYSVSKNSKVLNFEQELPARHLFRPLAMSTEQFGEKWTSTSCDTREHVTMTSRRSCEVVVDSVAKYLHFEAVDIKGSEAILAGSVLGNDVCLLHMNVVNADLELWAKSSNKKLSEMIMGECLSACDILNKTA